MRTQVRFFLLVSVGIVLMLAFNACNSTKYVPEGERLLRRVSIKTSSSEISKEDLKLYLRQDGNLRILGIWRLHLGVYNLSGRDESKGFNRWLRRIGEAPVIFDSTLVDRSVEQMSLYMRNQGYYLSEVTDTVIFPSRRKARVVYNIQSGPQYKINNLSYRIEDDSLATFFYRDTTRTLLRKGRGFTSDIHDRERDRITRNLQNKGFYNFSKEYMYFIADSSVGNYRINDTLVLVRPPENVAGRNKNGSHTRYVIGDVYFQVGEDYQMGEDFSSASSALPDTVFLSGFYIVFKDKLDFKPDVLINSSYIYPGDLYQADLVEKTQSLLSGLRIFKYINIRFRELPGVMDENGNHILNCIVQVVPGRYQSVAFELEGTNSSGNLGAAGNVKYQHKNVFNGAEMFTFNTRLSRQNQFVTKSGASEDFNTTEIGGEASVVFPSFILPFKIEKFRQRYNPKTTISMAYNYQERPDYTRTIANMRYGYTWKAHRYSTHSFFPIDFNLVNIPVVDSTFQAAIENTFLKYTYEDHLILNLNYTYLYNQQQIGRRFNPFWYFRYTFESAGNALDIFRPFWEKSSSGDYSTILGIRYAQYVKTDFDLRYHQPINRVTSLTYRLFVGVGLPYGNLDVLPFEKRYFSGGANSIRAWPVRGLGPGTYKETTSAFYNQSADIKLEMNAEYRFPLFWLLEGAFFLDVGNIWSIRSSSSLDGGLFEWDKFYKQLAIGTGFGTRFDFNYFIFRIDTGLKLHDPAAVDGEQWIPVSRRFTWDDVAFNFAIGYPF
ncbi:translocation and assembly module lipoprotein TamL [Geofilum sp. OHC36d9]|uniref:translocation and assembly module lipoprotein TamL n=1 Tax=Geofilum sp. OHC36d9 TaxID=3458413 RepID=UPI00403482C7